MDKLGTWLAITGVAIGFIVLGWLLFSDNPKGKSSRPISTGLISRSKRINPRHFPWTPGNDSHLYPVAVNHQAEIELRDIVRRDSVVTHK